jgi:hypothetical protein
MEMRRDMVVWAPTEAEMNVIRRRVSKERAKAAADLFRAVRSIVRNEKDPARTPDRVAAGC